MTIRTKAQLGIAAMALVMMTACQLEEAGEEEGFDFSDQTPALSSEGAQRPLALGATMNIQIQARDAVQVVEARSSDPRVLKVALTADGVAQIEGASAGKASLIALDAEGNEGRLDVEVAAIADTIIHVLPWDAFAALPEDLFARGVAILPSSPVEIFPQHLDAEGRALTGFGAAAWNLEGDEGASITSKNDSDFSTLRSGDAGHTLAISNGSGALSIEVVEEAAVESVAFREFFIGEIDGIDAGQTLDLTRGQLTLFHLVANLADGRYVIGGGSSPMTVSLSEGPTSPLKVLSSAQVEDDNQDLKRIMDHARAFGLEAVEPGDAVVTVGWLGHVEAFEVVVR